MTACWCAMFAVLVLGCSGPPPRSASPAPSRYWQISKSGDKCTATEICGSCDATPHDYPCPQSIELPVKIVSVDDRCVVDMACPPGAVGYENCPKQLLCP